MPKNQPPMPGDPAPPTGEIVLYQTEDGRTRVECRFVDETLWLSQALIAELFQKDVRTVNEHLQDIYQEGEVEEQATIRKFRIVRREGPRDVEREIEHYNLDAILAVGYRVRSERGTQFRRWATERLSEYLVKGFTMDDLRLKNPPGAGAGVPDYFDELLERIRDIRASEKRMYLRVREIFSLAGDYDPGRKETLEFFQIIQNRLHFSATGQTAPELIAGRADRSKPNMGLTSWKGGVVRKADEQSGPVPNPPLCIISTNDGGYRGGACSLPIQAGALQQPRAAVEGIPAPGGWAPRSRRRLRGRLSGGNPGAARVFRRRHRRARHSSFAPH